MLSAVDGRFTSRSQGGRQNMPLRMPFRVFCPHQSAFDQPAYVRMIASEAKNASVTQEIETAVSDVGEIELPPSKNESRTGSAHALE